MVYQRIVESILEPPTHQQLEIIRNEINEISEDKLHHNIKLMKEWASCQNHFPKHIPNWLIKGFLRGCRHNLSKTQRKMEHHFTARSLYTEMYLNRSPYNKDIVKVMDVMNIVNLPKLNDKGQRMWLFRLNSPDINELNMQAVTKLFLMLYDIMMTSQEPTNGEIAIFDGFQFGASHLSKLITSLKSWTVLFREAYAIRLKKIHIVNAPNMLEKGLTVIKSLLHNNVKESFMIHKSVEDFKNTIGAELLPCDYGGHQKLLRQLALDWYEVLNDNADWFENQEHLKIVGPIPQKFESALHYRDQMLGVEGSFRKLNID